MTDRNVLPPLVHRNVPPPMSTTQGVYPNRGARPARPRAAASSAHPGVVLIVVGAGFLALFVVAFMMQVQTNEAFILNTNLVNAYKPNWSILAQLPSLVSGTLNPSEAAATIFGWGIELVYLGFIVGYELLQDSVQQSGRLMMELFRTASWMMVAFNMWTDFTFGTLGSGFWGHSGFAAIISFIVGFFGTIGLTLIRRGLVNLI